MPKVSDSRNQTSSCLQTSSLLSRQAFKTCCSSAVSNTDSSIAWSKQSVSTRSQKTSYPFFANSNRINSRVVRPLPSLNVTKGNPAPARQMQLQGFCMFSISLGRNGYQVSVENDLDFIISYSDYLDKQFGDCLFLLKRILPPTVNTVLDFFGR